MMINRNVTGRFTYFKQAILFLLIATSCQNRDKIAFKDATGPVEDSIFMMRKQMMTFIPREVNNFFYDNDENLFINNVKIGRFDEGDSEVFIDSIQMETGFSRNEALRFVRLSLFLKDNYLDGCQLNVTNGAYHFSYKKTSSNERKDVREIVVDTDFGRTYVAGNQEHYIVVDKTGRLVLLRLPPKE